MNRKKINLKQQQTTTKYNSIDFATSNVLLRVVLSYP